MPDSTHKMPDLHRREMPKQPHAVRAQNFSEVALGYSPALAQEEARRCLQCKKPLCVPNCPVQVPIPEFIQAIADGDYAQGSRILKSRNALPSICGRVCPQEEQCEINCALTKRGGTIAIGRLERFLGDWDIARPEKALPTLPAPSGKKAAIVGGGPAGLTAAADLVALGHQVVIFEALHKMGGVLSYGIPEFRLPKKIVDGEIDALRQLGVEMRVDFVVGKTRTLDSLLEEFDALFVATGAGLPWFMEMPGNNLNGVYSANEYLTRINLMQGYRGPQVVTPVKAHHNVAVLGGRATILYRRSRKELPARLEEVENAEEEGVIFKFLTLPVNTLGDDSSRVTGLECLSMELGEPDESGRRSPRPIPGSEHFLPFDCVIHAIGNSPNPLIPATTSGLAIGKKGNIIVDPATGKTSRPRVWAGGDIATGAATVILAMGAGRKAASSMHEYMVNEMPW